jgi:hypothetical protein
MRYIFFWLLINLLLGACQDTEETQKKTKQKTVTLPAIPGNKLISQTDSGLEPSIYDAIALDASTSTEQKNTAIDGLKEALKEKNLFVRERAVDESLKNISKSSEIASQINKKLTEDEQYQEAAFFDKQSQDLASSLLTQASLGKITPPPGRLKYWQMISSDKWVLGVDIDRMNAKGTLVLIGNQPFIPAKTSTLERFRQLSAALEKYVVEQAPNRTFSVGMGKIGPFWNSEIIASIGQGIAVGTLKKSVEQGIFPIDKPFNPNDDKHIFSFILENGHILKYSYQINQTVIDVAEPEDKTKHKPITYLVEVFFDLATGEIKIERAYTVDGKTTRWSDNP